MVMARPEIVEWPCSLDPLPDESIAGLLLRMAHRNELSPYRAARLSGIMVPAKRLSLSSRYLLELPPQVVEELTLSWRITPDEARRLTLRDAAPNYPPLRSTYLGRRRELPLMVSENWVLIRSSRYCPECLAGDDSQVQRDHGGPWRRTWRLPVTFACLRHNRLPEYQCPHCGGLANSAGRRSEEGGWLPGHLVPNPQALLHPAQCRTAVLPPRLDGKSRELCTGRLDDAGTAIRPPPEFIALQKRLLTLTRQDIPITSMGSPASVDEYIADVRMVIVLMAATWPAIQSLVPGFEHFDKIGDYLDRQHAVLAVRAEHQGEKFVISLPVEVGACAALLTLVDGIIVGRDSSSIILELAARVVDPQPLRQRIVDHERHCSSGFRSVLSRLPEKFRPTRKGPRPEFPQPVIRAVAYEPRHVPQRLPEDWLVDLQELKDVSGLLMRRDAAIRLVQMAEEMPRVQAGVYLGIPYTPALTDGARIAAWLRESEQATQYFHALRRLADRIGADGHLVDYRHRREFLHKWTIPEEDWAPIVSELQRRQRPDRVTVTRWAPAKYLGASTYVWAQVTGSEPKLNPAIQGKKAPDDSGHGPSQHAWLITNAGKPGLKRIGTHYAQLRELLDAYCLDVIARIDR